MFLTVSTTILYKNLDIAIICCAVQLIYLHCMFPLVLGLYCYWNFCLVVS